MLVKGIKEQTATLKKLENLLKDDKRTVHGVFYTNSFFTQRYLCRANMLTEHVKISEDEVKLTVIARVEKRGLMELENTLDMLVQHTAGDMPGYSPEVPLTRVEDLVDSQQFLISVDLLLILRTPKVTYQEFTIAGSKFTLVNIHNSLEEYFSQTVTLLFGDADKLYLFSHFFNKELNARDARMILDLIVDENITGKSITAVKQVYSNGNSSGVFPYHEHISSYTNTSGEYVFGTGSGYIHIPEKRLSEYKMTFEPFQNGNYCVHLTSKSDTVHLYMT